MLIIVSQFLYRYLGLLVFVTLAVLWFIFGFGFTQNALQTSKDKYDAILSDFEKKMEREDPVAATKLARYREDQQVNKLALATHLVRAESQAGLVGVRDVLVKQDSLQNDALYGLAALATSPDQHLNSEMRTAFLTAQSCVVELLLQSENPTLAQEYISRLQVAANDPEAWAQVFDDAFALVIFDHIKTPELRKYYLQERGKDWFEEAMLSFVDRYGIEDDSQDTPQDWLSNEKLELLVAFLECARLHHPNFKKALVEYDLGVDVFPIFDQFGRVIDVCSQQYDIPLNETLDVLFANQDFVGEQLEQLGHERVAASLHLIRTQKPSVWKEAQDSVMVLRLEHDVPNFANQICTQYQGQDIPAFIYAAYEEQAGIAATAIAQYGDLALYVLLHYSEIERFHQLLADPSIGVRAIVYVAKFGDPGIDQLETNRAWLDKYFKPDGTPIEKEWWTSFPGGEIANVARNWATGKPNEWGELGWATVDTAEAILLVVSFGSSTVITKPLSQAAKVAVKRNAKSQLIKNGKKFATKQRGKSILTQVSKMVSQSFKLTKNKVGKWVTTLAVVRKVQSVAQQSIAAAKRVIQTWKRVPAGTRRIVYRSLLAVGLIVTLVERTIPNLGKVVQGIVNYPVDLMKDGFVSLAEQFMDAKAFVDRPGSYLTHWIQWCFYIGVELVLLVLAAVTFPREGTIRYVR